MAKKTGPGRWERSRTLLLVLSFGTVAGALVLFLRGPAATRPPIGSILLLVAAIVAYAGYWFLSKSVHTETRRSDDIPLVAAPPPDFPARVDEMSGRLQYAASLLTLGIINEPRSFFERITDSTQAGPTSVHQSTTYTLRVASEYAGHELAVPLMLQPRGKLMNGLKIFGPDGNRLSSLSRWETVALFMAIARKHAAVLGPDAPRQLKNYEEGLRDYLARKRPNTQAEWEEIGSKLFSLPFDTVANSEGAPKVLWYLWLAFNRLDTNYPVVVVWRARKRADDEAADERVRFRVEYDSLPRLGGRSAGEDKSVWWRSYVWIRNTIRTLLGIGPSLIASPLQNAERAQSYHMEIAGPAGTYLARQSVVDVRLGEVDLTQVESAMQPRVGQSASHLYLQRAAGLESAYFVNYFYERTPGSIGIAAVTALASTVLTTLGGFARLGYSPGLSSDLLAAALAFPALAAALLGMNNVSALHGGTLAARLSLLGTLLVSLAGAAYYVLGPAVAYDKGMMALFDRPGVHVWLLLIGLSAVNLAAMSGSWLLRSNVERTLIARSSEEN